MWHDSLDHFHPHLGATPAACDLSRPHVAHSLDDGHLHLDAVPASSPSFRPVVYRSSPIWTVRHNKDSGVIAFKRPARRSHKSIFSRTNGSLSHGSFPYTVLEASAWRCTRIR